MGGGEFTNAVSGKIKLVKETLALLDGHWDDKVVIRDSQGSVGRLTLSTQDVVNVADSSVFFSDVR